MHNALKEASINTKILYLKKNHTENEDSYEYVRDKNESLGLVEKENINLLNFTKEKNNFFGKVNTDAFSFPRTSFKKLTSNKYVVEADIIHLHWVAHFLDYETFFYRIRKPIVWTFHDSNPFEGLFHFVGDDRKNPWLNELSMFYKRIKSNAFSKSNIHVVTPSKWLMKRFKKTGFKYSSSNIINNSIVNNYVIKKSNLLNFKKYTNEISVFFIAWDLSTNCKRFRLYVDLANKYSAKNIKFYCVGIKNCLDIPETIKWLGSNRNSSEIYALFSKMDVTISCSKNDNFPNVILESLSAGTPVVGTPSGGIPELINEKTGIKSNKNTFSSLCKAFETYLINKNNFDRNTIIKYTMEKYSTLKQGEKYIQLYKNILNHRAI